MGFLTKVLGENDDYSPITAPDDSSIQTFEGETQLTQTVNLSGGLNPNNIGKSLTAFRAIPSVDQARGFNKKEAEILSQKADELHAMADYSDQAYTALERIEKSQERINLSFSKYAKVNLRSTYNTAQSLADLHNTGQSYRPLYSQLGESMQTAKNEAESKLQALKKGLA